MLPCHTESTNIDGLQHSVPHKLGSRGTSESRKMLSRYIHFLKTGIESICKAKKSLAFEVLKSVEYHRRWDLAAEICYGSSEADLRKTSQPGSAEVPSRRQKPGARCSSTAATWDSKSSSLESASLTTDRFFSQRLMGSNLSAKFQVKKRKLIRNMKRLPPVSWRSSKTDVSLSLSGFALLRCSQLQCILGRAHWLERQHVVVQCLLPGHGRYEWYRLHSGLLEPSCISSFGRRT